MLRWSKTRDKRLTRVDDARRKLEPLFDLKPNPTEFFADTFVPEPPVSPCCPRHDACLDVAVLGNWSSMSCGNCPAFQHAQQFTEAFRQMRLLQISQMKLDQEGDVDRTTNPAWLQETGCSYKERTKLRTQLKSKRGGFTKENAMLALRAQNDLTTSSVRNNLTRPAPGERNNPPIPSQPSNRTERAS